MNKTQEKKVIATINKIEKIKFSICNLINEMYTLTDVLYCNDVDLSNFNSDIYNALDIIECTFLRLQQNAKNKLN